MSEILALQGAIVQRLANDGELLNLIPIDLMADEEKNQRLYDYIPKEAISPYIHVSEPIVTRNYYKPQLVQDVRVTLHMWHNQVETGDYGSIVIARVLYAVKQALRFKLSPVGYEVIDVTIENERIFEDVNADVKHAIFTLTYKMMKQ